MIKTTSLIFGAMMLFFAIGAMMTGPAKTIDMAPGVGAVLYIAMGCFIGILYLVINK